MQKIARSGGRRENIWGISCEKSRFYAKKIIFFPILVGARAPGFGLHTNVLHIGEKHFFTTHISF
jgi:hypothetical protein